MIRITTADFRACDICFGGKSRHWFQRHGLDWRDFVRNGIDLDHLREIGDQQDRIDQLEASARARHGKE